MTQSCTIVKFAILQHKIYISGPKVAILYQTFSVLGVTILQQIVVNDFMEKKKVMIL